MPGEYQENTVSSNLDTLYTLIQTLPEGDVTIKINGITVQGVIYRHNNHNRLIVNASLIPTLRSESQPWTEDTTNDLISHAQ